MKKGKPLKRSILKRDGSSLKSTGKLTRSPISKYNVNTNEKVKQRKEELTSFFGIAISTLKPISIESDTRIQPLERKNIAHILPKWFYRSVECDLMNVVVLTWSEHSRFDDLLNRLDVEGLQREFPRTCQIIRERLPYLNEVTKESGKILSIINKL